MASLNHVSMQVVDVAASSAFYQSKGMTVCWQPDPDNIYLTSGSDMLALHASSVTRVDHLGFILETKVEVDAWYAASIIEGEFVSPLEVHRDGAYGYYTQDPNGFSLEIIWIPRLRITRS